MTDIRSYLDIVQNPSLLEEDKGAMTSILKEGSEMTFLDEHPLSDLLDEMEALSNKIEAAFIMLLKAAASDISKAHPGVTFKYEASMGSYGVDVEPSEEMESLHREDDDAYGHWLDFKNYVERNPPHWDDWSLLNQHHATWACFDFKITNGKVI